MCASTTWRRSGSTARRAQPATSACTATIRPSYGPTSSLTSTSPSNVGPIMSLRLAGGGGHPRPRPPSPHCAGQPAHPWSALAGRGRVSLGAENAELSPSQAGSSSAPAVRSYRPDLLHAPVSLPRGARFTLCAGYPQERAGHRRDHHPLWFGRPAPGSVLELAGGEARPRLWGGQGGHLAR